MNIRQVQQQDNPILAHIIRTVFDEHNAPHEGTVYVDPSTDALYETFQIEKAVLWVAEMNGEVKGCCGIYPTDGLPTGYAEMAKFYLSADARGLGVGRALLDQSLISAKDMGYTSIYLESHPVWQTAVGFYTHLGFETLNKPMGNSGHTACTIWMKKTL